MQTYLTVCQSHLREQDLIGWMVGRSQQEVYEKCGLDMIDVKKVAKLARLQLNSEEEVVLQKQVESIIGYFEELKNIDTQAVEPLVTPSEIEPTLRVDEVVRWDENELALENAPEKSGNLFKVPPVV